MSHNPIGLHGFVAGIALPVFTEKKRINLLGARRRQTTISSVQQARHYNNVFDTIRDNAHMQQISQNVEVVESQQLNVCVLPQKRNRSTCICDLQCNKTDCQTFLLF
jgi:hypothetical protein